MTEDELFAVVDIILNKANAAELEVYNGDTGVVVKTPEGTEAVFGTGLGPRTFSPYLLDGLSSVHREQDGRP